MAVGARFRDVPPEHCGSTIVNESFDQATILTAGVFGLVPTDQRELIVMGLIFGLVFVINRLRPIRVLEATGF